MMDGGEVSGGEGYCRGGRVLSRGKDVAVGEGCCREGRGLPWGKVLPWRNAVGERGCRGRTPWGNEVAMRGG